MNEVIKCVRVFTRSPLRVRLQLLNIVCGLISEKSGRHNAPR
ncbi:MULTISPECIES: manganase accumulation protein MntS [Tenebrionibacter/Tenebrionicola group]|uniref:Manganase accumulation protein MntS n=2 Tax=Tenebrionibacter/Tenebrionicola group TaxID=2969848 RepID=A0A8K0V9K4_9ENTR|nr:MULTISPECIES: manganase accumulation protein MntS [Tenebrionibacter/Tenebrionicola group]MBK4716695.1 manganase accumulation protein MntS [Tenebrionibacter intestinalis]MBV4412276.1 manganase accumulation protein MntS [Tenebrionicola larvae]MBV5097357.1 manganase accumulation protein MntS [Tenebrionicola larvae]